MDGNLGFVGQGLKELNNEIRDLKPIYQLNTLLYLMDKGLVSKEEVQNSDIYQNAKAKLTEHTEPKESFAKRLFK